MNWKIGREQYRTQMNALKPTYIVSFPRSGQHLVVRGLMWVMPDLVVYSEGYQVLHNIENNGAVNIQKSHDFDLKLEVKSEYQYLVLTRDFIPALKSWWRMAVGNGMEDSEESFRNFCLDGKKAYYEGFMAKWKPLVDGKRVRMVSFDELVAKPWNSLRWIVDFVLNEIPEHLRFENSREEAFISFSDACSIWRMHPRAPFRYDQILSEMFPE